MRIGPGIQSAFDLGWKTTVFHLSFGCTANCVIEAAKAFGAFINDEGEPQIVACFPGRLPANFNISALRQSIDELNSGILTGAPPSPD